MSILIDELAGIIGDALVGANVPYSMTLSRTTAGEPDEDKPWLPVEPTIESWACMGFEDTWSAYYIANSLVTANDLKIAIVANTLDTTPQPGDTITSRGVVYTVGDYIKTDPARAIWEIQAR
jgi:hypothetical protein